jgi:hypothetical protein
MNTTSINDNAIDLFGRLLAIGYLNNELYIYSNGFLDINISWSPILTNNVLKQS